MYVIIKTAIFKFSEFTCFVSLLQFCLQCIVCTICSKYADDSLSLYCEYRQPIFGLQHKLLLFSV